MLEELLPPGASPRAWKWVFICCGAPVTMRTLFQKWRASWNTARPTKSTVEMWRISQRPKSVGLCDLAVSAVWIWTQLPKAGDPYAQMGDSMTLFYRILGKGIRELGTTNPW